MHIKQKKTVIFKLWLTYDTFVFFQLQDTTMDQASELFKINEDHDLLKGLKLHGLAGCPDKVDELSVKFREHAEQLEEVNCICFKQFSNFYLIYNMTLFFSSFSFFFFSLFSLFFLNLRLHLEMGWGCPRGVMVKAMDCGIIVNKFVFQSRYYIHFRANTLGKGMNPLIVPAMG